MAKRVFIAEKPSVARQFADALDERFTSRDGCLVSSESIVTWCVGHLVTMCYPDAYDAKYKKWSLATIPFVPDAWRYQVIDSVRKQFGIVKGILTDPEVDTIYICTDSGREGEYIYRLVAQEAGVKDKRQLRVWIDSQTKEEILRGIREAKDDREYDPLGAAAYLRAKEDYLMGINFSRALTLRYGKNISSFLGTDRCVIAVGRVMTCVLGMVVSREREIRSFVKTPFFRVIADFRRQGQDPGNSGVFTAEWHVSEHSAWFNSPALYKENGFKRKEDAEKLIASFGPHAPAAVESINRRSEKKNAPLLYNLAELQNDCSRIFHISPDQTLQAAQELYEKKLTTYPRTDARVLSSAVAKEITVNLNGLFGLPMYKEALREIASLGTAKTIGKTRYTDDSAITDHYAIIPTGQGLSALNSLSEITAKVYELIVRRFLSVFYPPAVFDKIALQIRVQAGEHEELFSANFRSLKEEGYLKVAKPSFLREKEERDSESEADLSYFEGMRKGTRLDFGNPSIKEGETQPPKRYGSGSMILAMENAGSLIEDEELREQIRGSGIGTSATRAEILKKLFTNRYLDLNRKTQIITPTILGELIFDTVSCSLRPLLDPKLTASWEMGLTRVAEGTVSEAEYMAKLSDFVTRRTDQVKNTDFTPALNSAYAVTAGYYKDRPFSMKGGAPGTKSGKGSSGRRRSTGKKASDAKS